MVTSQKNPKNAKDINMPVSSGKHSGNQCKLQGKNTAHARWSRTCSCALLLSQVHVVLPVVVHVPEEVCEDEDVVTQRLLSLHGVLRRRAEVVERAGVDALTQHRLAEAVRRREAALQQRQAQLQQPKHKTLQRYYSNDVSSYSFYCDVSNETQAYSGHVITTRPASSVVVSDFQ